MSMNRIYADGRRDEWPDSQPEPAEACTEVGAEQEQREASWRLADAVTALIAVGCVVGYFSGVFA